MGKTQKGAVWLNPEKTTPYDFYQYWRNVNDADVEKCLSLLTYVPMDKVHELCQFKDERINEAKKVLAYEVTKIVHSEEIANQVKAQVEAAFSGNSDNMLTVEIPRDMVSIVDILVEVGACKSKGEARNVIAAGGVKVDEEKVPDFTYTVSNCCMENGFVLHKGKKMHIKIQPKK